MQTQCPHCDTYFRITETQINLAEGLVRCSVCNEVFNALEIASQHEQQASLLGDALTGNRPQPVTETTAATASNSEWPPTDEQPVPDKISDETSTNDFDNNIQPLPEDTQSVATQGDTEESITLASNEASNEVNNETAATDDTQKDAFDFFNEESNKSLSHVVPEKYRDTYTTTSSTLSNLLWTAGSLILIAALVIQYAWLNRNQLNQAPQTQAWLEKICQQVECKNISIREPGKIELISRNVYSHPNEKNALMINITMRNNAGFAQPYPVMQVAFSDVRGTAVAARRFLPAEYLPVAHRAEQQTSTEQYALFEPGTNMTFTMEIQDPGKKAMTYEFDFL
ncbi:MAG: DUF3426 domain-containing protein [Gammaproteobacteria bacterium]|nr:DUF3426 domain-containing protein [Gammaproteobacteria bacterium]